ncbi:MAG: hypothetical protein G01um10143_134 [Parcubacteria group bacterium Gr01-1014_3]|nr:MAG: hypothetical protein G01um10143_134 [Parcubacteria group bacterium Gr01-1014_3]
MTIATNKKTVILAVSNYIASSDLLRTKYLEYLSSKYRVVVLSPILDEARVIAGGYLRSPEITYIHRPIENPRFWEFFKFLRISLVNEFDYLKSVKYFYLRPNYADNKKRRLFRFFGRPFSRLLTANFFSKIEAWLLPVSKSFKKIIQEYQPSVLITATPGFDPWEAELIFLANRESLPTVSVNFSWDNLTMNSKHIRKTDFMIAWNEIMRKEAIGIHHYSTERVFVSGIPRFDPYFVKDSNEPTREEFLKSKKLNPNLKTIFHTTVTKAYPFQKKYIRDLIELRNKKQIPYTNLFIRIHPLDLPENYDEFRGAPDLYIEKAGVGGSRGKVEMSYDDLLNLKYSLKYSDLNINYASTITIESSIFDVPVINIGFLDRFALAYEFTHYEPIYQSGAVRLVKTDDELPKFINMYLADSGLDREYRKKIVDEYAQFTDGLSYKRSVDFLEELGNI